MTPALLVALALGQPPAGPLSPADLPPPPRPHPTPTSAPAVGPVGPAGAVCLNMKTWVSNDSPAAALRTAAAVLAGSPGVRYVGGEAGVVEVYTADTRAVVFAVPTGSGAQVYVAAASMDKAAAAGLTRAVEDGGKASPRPDGPTRVGARDPGLEKALPVIDWHADIRPVRRTTRHFVAVASLLFDKGGWAEAVSSSLASDGTGLAGADRPDQTACVFQTCGPAHLGVSMHFVTVSAASPGARECPARPLGEALVRLLYD